jgi:serine/threonine-protein kinase
VIGSTLGHYMVNPTTSGAWPGTYRVEDLAIIYMMTGEHDLAVDQLELLLSRPGDLSVSILKVDPIWDPLRDNPRFRALLQE